MNHRPRFNRPFDELRERFGAYFSQPTFSTGWTPKPSKPT